MTEQTTYTLLASCFGFVAAIYFAIGTAFINKKTIALMASTYWGYNEEQANAIVSQSAQYLIGALLLLFSFVLQVVAILSSPTTLLIQYPILATPIFFVLLWLLLIGGLSWSFCNILTKWKKSKVQQELKKIHTT